MQIVILFCFQVLKHLDLLHTLQCYFISVLFTADIISTVEFNYSGDLLATGDKGGRVVIFQREQEVSDIKNKSAVTTLLLCCTSHFICSCCKGYVTGWVAQETQCQPSICLSTLCWIWEVSLVVVSAPHCFEKKPPQKCSEFLICNCYSLL